jgi:protein-disulfide isomerase
LTQNFKILSLAAALAGGLFVFSPAQAENITPAQKEEIQSIIRQYLNENPEIIIESVELYRQKQEEQMNQQAAAKIGDHDAFLTGADAPFAGNAKGDVTVVEFFDYNCGYCKKALDDIQSILKEDTNVRFVFREMPILGPSSAVAARWAIAAHKQGKYFEYHTALMNHNGNKDEREMEKLAKDVGLDVDQMKKDAESEETKATIEKSLAVSRDIGIQGTPAFLVNGQMIRGYVGEAGMKEAINVARSGEKKG